MKIVYKITQCIFVSVCFEFFEGKNEKPDFLAQKAEKRSGRKLKMQMRKVKKEIPQPGFEPRPPNSKTDHMSTTPPELSCERCKEIDTYTNC